MALRFWKGKLERSCVFWMIRLTAQLRLTASTIFLKKRCTKHQQTDFVGGCLFGNTALEASDTSPVYAQIVAEVFNAWAEKLRPIIAQAQDSELTRRDVPAEQLAQLVVATIEGAIMQSRLHKSAEPMTHALETLRTLLGLKLQNKLNT